MATINSKTIGPTGDYATLALWWADCPANLTTADATGYIYRGKVQAAGIIGTVGLLAMTGKTGCDATHYVELTADDNASFVDNANAATNALRYNEANGAFIRATDMSGLAVSGNLPYTRVNKLQIASTSTGATPATPLSITGANSTVEQCVIEGFCASTLNGIATIEGSGSKIKNSLVANKRASGGTTLVRLASAAGAYNCTFVGLGGIVATGVWSEFGTAVVENCYVGGVTALSIGTLSATTNKTSVSGPPAGWTVAAMDTSAFESVTNGTHDLRLRTGSALIDAGTTDATNAPNDILGRARSGSWDIGAWEVVAGGGTNATALGGTGTSTGSGSGGTATGGAAGSGTITIPAIKDLTTGALRANESAITVIIADQTTGALVIEKTGQTSNASGICTVTDAAITSGVTYRVTTIHSDGSEGTWKYAAA